MITDKQILEGIQVNNKNRTQKDVEAFRRFMHGFDCEDASTYEEAKERILASMDILQNDIKNVPYNIQGIIVKDRLRNFNFK